MVTVAEPRVASERPSRPRASDTKAKVKVEFSEPAVAAPGVRTTLPVVPAAMDDGLVRPMVGLLEVAATRRSSWNAASETTTLLTTRLRVRLEPARTLPSERVEATDGRAYS